MKSVLFLLCLSSILIGVTGSLGGPPARATRSEEEDGMMNVHDDEAQRHEESFQRRANTADTTTTSTTGTRRRYFWFPYPNRPQIKPPGGNPSPSPPPPPPPEVKPDDPLTSSCSSTRDCGMGHYCASGICREMGTCSSVSDCRNPLNHYGLIECVGPIICENEMCGRDCTSSSTNCPDSAEPVRCLESPCTVLKQTCGSANKYISCVDDYCGGCNALAFDEAGTLLATCNGETPPAEDENQNNNNNPDAISCLATRDCPSDHFCGSGQCLPYGGCVTDIDCRNPNNQFALMATCRGHLYCDVETNTCGLNCQNGPSPCSDGSAPVNCYAQPCSVVRCGIVSEFCIDDYCGGCNAIFLDFAGNPVCQP